MIGTFIPSLMPLPQFRDSLCTTVIQAVIISQLFFLPVSASLQSSIHYQMIIRKEGERESKSAPLKNPALFQGKDESKLSTQALYGGPFLYSVSSPTCPHSKHLNLIYSFRFFPCPCTFAHTTLSFQGSSSRDHMFFQVFTIHFRLSYGSLPLQCLICPPMIPWAIVHNINSPSCHLVCPFLPYIRNFCKGGWGGGEGGQGRFMACFVFIPYRQSPCLAESRPIHVS